MSHTNWNARFSRSFLLSLMLSVMASQSLFAGDSSTSNPQELPPTSIQDKSFGRVPLSFEANGGQADAHAKFISRGDGYTLFLTPADAVLKLRRAPKDSGAVTSAVLRMRLIGAHSTPQISGVDKLPGVSNYLTGNDSAKWRTNVPHFGKVRYEGVYKGIDLVYYGNQRQLEFDFVVAPGADPSVIRMAFEGANKVDIDSAGDLVLEVGGGQIRQHKPVLYQNVNDKRRPVQGRYVLTGPSEVAFHVDDYERRLPLVIDPVLVYSTYLGGSGNDFGRAIAVDVSGNVYVTGNTLSTDFPVTGGALQTTWAGTGGTFNSGDVFITKLNANGTAVVYSTFLGGSGDETAAQGGIKVDGSGNVYVAGNTTSGNFPTVNPAQASLSGGDWGDFFVSKLNASGNALVYSTYLGGPNRDWCGGIAIDGSGNAYVTGFGFSGFPTTGGAYQTSNNGGPEDVVVAKISSAGALSYSTYVGGGGSDGGGACIAVDGSGNAYVSGNTNGGFPMVSPIQATNNGSYTGYLFKLNTTGSALVYSTYMGGNNIVEPHSIAVDGSSAVYIAGKTNSTTYPVVGAFQNTNAGGNDGFVTKINAAGSAIIYSTYLGTANEESINSIAIDGSGIAHLIGNTDSASFPTLNPIQGANGGGYDAFVAILNSAGNALSFSSYLGGSGNDFGNGIAVDSVGNAYVVGEVNSTNFPTQSPIQAASGGGTDGFVAKIAFDTGKWTATGSMGTARRYHTAVLLQNGKVLVAGGRDDGGAAIGTAELYDPATGTWSPTGNLITARGTHSAVLLPNGKVLVCGGTNPGALVSAELYDPASGTWASTGSMANGRSTHGLALLSNGKVLAAGGLPGTSAELFDPATGAWGSTGNMLTSRQQAVLTVLPNGKVLVSGGDPATVACEIYDPVAGTWSATGDLGTARINQKATLLPNGKVLASAGNNGNTAEIFDPGAGSWSVTGNLPFNTSDHRIALLPNGKVLVAGGATPGTIASTALFDPASGSWTAAPNMGAARAAHTATLLPDGQVLVAGGFDSTNHASCEIYSYAVGSWSATGSMGTARSECPVVRLPNGKILISGGLDSGTFFNTCEVYDPAAGTWSGAAPMAVAHANHTATLLPSGKILVAGGHTTGSAFTTAVELYDPVGNAWNSAAAMPIPRAIYKAVVLNSGKVLVAGGRNGGAYENTASVYDPVADTWSATANNMSAGRSELGLVLLPNGKVLAIGGSNGAHLNSCDLYDPGTNSWSPVASMNEARRKAITMLLDNGKVLAAGGVTPSGVTLTAELYDPTGNTWTYTGSLTTAPGEPGSYMLGTRLRDGTVLAYCLSGSTNCERYNPATGIWNNVASSIAVRTAGVGVLLECGTLLLTSGTNGGAALATAELFDLDSGFQNSWRPVINSATSPLALGAKLVLSGTKFKGISEASGGGYQSSATNYPLVKLRSLVNDQSAFLLPDSTANWSDTAFTSVAVNGFPQGYAQITVYTNGIPSESKTILISSTAPSINSPLTAMGTVGVAFSYTITASNSPSSFIATGLPAGLSINTSSGSITGTPTAAGTTNVSISAANADGTDTKTLSIAINKGTPVVTWNNPADITYPAALGGTQLNATADVAGSFVYTPSSGTVLNVGTNQSLSVQFTPTDTANYNSPAAMNITINVLSGGPVITWANPADITYPAALSATQLNATANVPGSFAYTPALGAVLNAGNGQTLSVQFTPTDTNYSTITANVTINVAKGLPVVSWSNPADISYPAALGGTQLNATANVVGSFVYTPASGTVLNAGTGQTLSVQFTPTDTANYNTPAATTATLNVQKGTPVITWANPADVTFPYTLGATQLNATASVAGTFAYSPASGTELSAGAGQTLSTSFTPTDGANYNTASAAVTINVATGVFSLSVDPNPAKPGETVTFSLAAAAGTTVGWEFGDGSPVISGSSVTHSFTAEGFFTIKATISDGATSSTQKITLEVRSPANRVIGDFTIAPNPADVGKEMTFTATSNANAGTLIFIWNFGDGTTATGITAKHIYGAAGEYTVVLTAQDLTGIRGSSSQKAFVMQNNATLNLSDPTKGGPSIENKLDGLTVKVGDSKNAVISLDIDVQALNRDAFDVQTDFGIGRSAVGGLRPVNKYEQSGIFIAKTTASEIASGVEKGKVRKTITIGRDETGQEALVNFQPADRSIKMNGVKGKFLFTKNTPDQVTLSATIELPAGFDIKQEHLLGVALGNIVDNLTVTDKGAGASQGKLGRIKKLGIKYPKLSGTTLTSAGQKATVALTLYTPDMDVKGFDTEGVTNKVAASEESMKSVKRSLQMAILLDGVSYEALWEVDFALSKGKDAGQITGRSGR